MGVKPITIVEASMGLTRHFNNLYYYSLVSIHEEDSKYKFPATTRCYFIRLYYNVHFKIF